MRSRWAASTPIRRAAATRSIRTWAQNTSTAANGSLTVSVMPVIGRARAFDYLAWYQAAPSVEVVPSIPDRTKLVGDIRWGLPIYGTCSAAHFRKLELVEIGVFSIDQTRLDHFFPHLVQGTTYAIHDISLANGMKITGLQGARRWRRPDGKLERIVYPPRPTIVELMGSAA